MSLLRRASSTSQYFKFALTLFACGLAIQLAPPASAQQSLQKTQQGQVLIFTTTQPLKSTTTTIDVKNLGDVNVTEKKLVITLPTDSTIKVHITDMSVPAKSGPLCGGIVNGVAQQPCTRQPAKFESAALGTCPSGSFFDIGKWQCWTCPNDYPKRSIFPVDGDKACDRPDPNQKGGFFAAEIKGKVCPAGTFFDPIRDGECYSCPAGTRRSAAHIDAGNACFIPAGEELRGIDRHNKATGIFGTDCPGGQFWDGIDGFCYSCPSGFNRTAYSVRDNRACSRFVAERQFKSTLVKKGECEAGEIKDFLRDPEHGGECWKCPTATDRTVFPVNGGQACEKAPGLIYAKARKAADLTCPAGQIFDFISLTTQDIAAMKTRAAAAQDQVEVNRLASVQPVQSGTCWSCPTGYDRTEESVKGNGACQTKTIAWNTVPYSEPGLFGLKGAQEVLLDITRRQPKLVQDSIAKTAEIASKANKQPYAQVFEKEKALFLSSPEHSTAAAAAVFVRIIAAAADPKKASAAEKQLVESFSNHVRSKRAYVAQDALNAYDAWYAADNYWKAKRNSSGPQNLGILLDYGTVPPDFSTIALLGTMGMGAAGTAVDQATGKALDKAAGALAKVQGRTAAIAAGALPVVGAVVSMAFSAAGNGFADFSDPVTAVKFTARSGAEVAIGAAAEKAVEKMVQQTATKLAQKMIERGLAATLEKTAEQIAERTLAAAGSGPALIISGMMMIASIAVDQVIEIQNARPKLVVALANANYPPDLARIAGSDNGMTELLGTWSEAIAGEQGTTDSFKRDFASIAQAATASAAPAAAASAAASAAPASANWARMPGAANDIGIGANGAAWIVGNDVDPGGFGVYRLDGNNWTRIPGGGTRIAVDPQGLPWLVNKQGAIFHYDGRQWVRMPGAASDVSVGANGKVWIIGNVAEAGGYGIYRLDGNQWTKFSGGAVRIAVDVQGNPWVVNDKGSIYGYDGRQWNQFPGLARDIGIGAHGQAWVVGNNRVAGGYGVYKWNGSAWLPVAGGLTDLAVAPDGKPWGVNAAREIFRMQ